MSLLDFSNIKNSVAISQLFWNTIPGMFTIPVDTQKAYIEKLGEAKDDFDRSYKQYLCQRLLFKRWKTLLVNFLFCIIYPIYLVYAGMMSLKLKKVSFKYDAIGAAGLNKFLPEELGSKYSISESAYYNGVALNFKDIKFALTLLYKYPFSPYFVTKVILKVSYYSYMIHTFNPKAIIVFNEYSFTSSILTFYCEKHNVKHIDVLHGEKFYYIRDSYFRYHECWIWGEHYRKMFHALKADPLQFRIAIPGFLKIDCDKYKNEELFADYKYYLQEYNEEQIKSIIESMSFAKSEGSTVKYRPHPLWSNVDLLKKYVGEDEIEDPRNVTIQESISNTKYAIGSFSTVLNQADFSNRIAVLDDVTFPEVYKKLQEVDYILCGKKLPRLSDFLRN